MKKDERFLNLALEKASFHSDMAKYRMGAVIIKNNRDIVSTAHNIYQKNGELYTIHAEVMAIVRSDKRRLKDSSIYVAGYRKRRDGSRKHIISRPCKHCIKFLKAFGIKWMIYFDENGIIIKELVS